MTAIKYSKFTPQNYTVSTCVSVEAAARIGTWETGAPSRSEVEAVLGGFEPNHARNDMTGIRSHREKHLVERIGWLRAAVLGANDGIVSTASLIVGVTAAAATKSDVLIARSRCSHGGRNVR